MGSKIMMRRLYVLLIAVLTLALVAPSAASAHSKQAAAAKRIRGGTTTLTTATGLVNSLLGAKIVAFATAPGTASLIGVPNSPKLVARYPVSGGTFTGAAATYSHRGGLLLENLNNGKAVAVDKFKVSTKAKTLTAHLVGTTSRLAVFSLGLAHAKVRATRHSVTISGVRLSLLSSAASGLNALLGTTAFKGGMLFGTAVSHLRI